jgi:hypothetical protein
MTSLYCREKRIKKPTVCPVVDVKTFAEKNEFAEHKRQYEIHAAAWQVARARGEPELSRKCAQRMLRSLRGMYRLAQISKR